MAPSYRMGKGPIVRELEARLNQYPDRALAEVERVLAELDGGGLQRVTEFEEQALSRRDKDHLQRDVFGGQGGDERRRVYYQGLKDALELAKKLGTRRRPAPIQIFWGCGQPENECWVSWSRPGGKPVITLMFLSDVGAIGTDRDATGQRASRIDASEDSGMYVVRMKGNAAKAFKAKSSTIGV